MAGTSWGTIAIMVPIIAPLALSVSGGSPAAVAATNGYVKFNVQTWNAATTATTATEATMSTSGTPFSTFVAVPLNVQILVTAEFTCDQASKTFSSVLKNTNT